MFTLGEGTGIAVAHDGVVLGGIVVKTVAARAGDGHHDMGVARAATAVGTLSGIEASWLPT